MTDGQNPAAPGGNGNDPAHFAAKWRAVWPEWAIAEVFLSKASRPRVDAWQSLQFEFTEAAWGGADPRPGEAKLAWWAEELQGWSQGRRRHPLGSVLQRVPAAWEALAKTLPALAVTRERPRSAEQAEGALAAVTFAAAGIESQLFDVAATACSSAAITACWLHARLARHPADAVPLELLAQGAENADRRWADELLAGWPTAAGLLRYRSLVLGLAAARLRTGHASRPLPAPRALLTGWAAARDKTGRA